MLVIHFNDATTVQWYTQANTSWGKKFSPQTTSDLQGLEIMRDSQPVVLDLNGD